MKISDKPYTLDKNTWCYEERGGILVVHEDRYKNGNYIQTIQTKIPLKKIQGYLRRIGE